MYITKEKSHPLLQEGASTVHGHSNEMYQRRLFQEMAVFQQRIKTNTNSGKNK